MRPMVTNGGAHPADKWADYAVDAITDLMVDANPDNASPQAAAARQAKRDLRPALFAIINDFVDATQQAEQALPKHIKTEEQAHAHAYDIKIANDDLDAVMGKVAEALAKTPFAEHFAKDHPKAVLRAIIGQCAADAMHIERRYHHDRLTGAAKGVW